MRNRHLGFCWRGSLHPAPPHSFDTDLANIMVWFNKILPLPLSEIELLVQAEPISLPQLLLSSESDILIPIFLCFWLAPSLKTLQDPKVALATLQEVIDAYVENHFKKLPPAEVLSQIPKIDYALWVSYLLLTPPNVGSFAKPVMEDIQSVLHPFHPHSNTLSGIVTHLTPLPFPELILALQTYVIYRTSVQKQVIERYYKSIVKQLMGELSLLLIYRKIQNPPLPLDQLVSNTTLRALYDRYPDYLTQQYTVFNHRQLAPLFHTLGILDAFSLSPIELTLLIVFLENILNNFNQLMDARLIVATKELDFGLFYLERYWQYLVDQANLPLTLYHQLSFARFKAGQEPQTGLRKSDTKSFITDHIPLLIRSFFISKAPAVQSDYLKKCFILCHFLATFSEESQEDAYQKVLLQLEAEETDWDKVNMTDLFPKILLKQAGLDPDAQTDQLFAFTIEHAITAIFHKMCFTPIQWAQIHVRCYQVALNHQKPIPFQTLVWFRQAALQEIALSPQNHYAALTCLILHSFSPKNSVSADLLHDMIRRWVGYAKKLSYLPGLLVAFRDKEDTPMASLCVFLDNNAKFIKIYNPHSLAHRLLQALKEFCLTHFTQSSLSEADRICYLQDTLEKLYQTLPIPSVLIERKIFTLNPFDANIEPSEIPRHLPSIQFSRTHHPHFPKGSENLLTHLLEDTNKTPHRREATRKSTQSADCPF